MSDLLGSQQVGTEGVDEDTKKLQDAMAALRAQEEHELGKTPSHLLGGERHLPGLKSLGELVDPHGNVLGQGDEEGWGTMAKQSDYDPSEPAWATTMHLDRVHEDLKDRAAALAQMVHAQDARITVLTKSLTALLQSQNVAAASLRALSAKMEALEAALSNTVAKPPMSLSGAKKGSSGSVGAGGPPRSAGHEFYGLSRGRDEEDEPAPTRKGIVQTKEDVYSFLSSTKAESGKRPAK